MDFKFLAYADCPPGDWDALVEASPDGFMFATSSWRSIIMNYEEIGWTDYSFAVFQGARMVGVMPFGRQHWTNCMESYALGACGPIVMGSAGAKQRKKIIAALLEHAAELAQEHNAAEISFSAPAFSDTSYAARWGVNPWCEFGYEDRSSAACIIDLTKDEDILWKECAHSTRSRCKQALVAGFSCDVCDWRQEIDSYHALHVETYTRTGVQPRPKSYFADIANTTAPKGYHSLFVCRDAQGSPISYHNIAHMKHSAISHTACSAQKALENGGNYLLWWNTILCLKRMGITRFEIGEVFPGVTKDIWGAGKQYGLSVFKTQFGGEIHRSFRCTKNLSGASSRHAIPSKKQALRECLSAAKRLVAAFCGERTATILTGAAKSSVQIGKKLSSFFTPSRVVPFILPMWTWRDFAYFLWPWKYIAPRKRLAEKLQEQTGLQDGFMLLTSSGRVGIECALAILQERCPEKNKVIIPSYACTGIYTPVITRGLIPVAVDCDENLQPDAEAVRQCLDGALACVFQSLGGVLPDITALKREARQKDVAWISDYCQAYAPQADAIGADFVVYSFGQGKTISATAGGAVFSSHYAAELQKMCSCMDYEPARNVFVRLVQQFLSFSPRTRSLSRLFLFSQYTKKQYLFQRIALPDTLLLEAQIQKTMDILERRKENTALLLPHIPQGYSTPLAETHLYTKLSLICPSYGGRQRLEKAAREAGLELEGMYTPLHLRFSGLAFHSTSKGKSLCEKIYSSVLNIPVRENLTQAEIRQIISMLQST